MFIRNHNLVPTFDEDFESDFRLELNVLSKELGERNLKHYSIQDLKNFPQHHQVISAMACAGNRRKHTRKHFPDVKGINWDVGAVANNQYKGIPIRDLLIDSGIGEAEFGLLKGKHLVATGMDADFQGVPFSISIPIEHALDPKNEVILAYEMNG